MSFIYKNVVRLLPFKGKCESNYSENSEASVKTVHKKSWLRKYESFSVMIQSILIWEEPMTSFLALICMNIIYWFLALTDVSLVAVCSTVMLLVFWYDQWVNRIWPAIRVPPQQMEDSEEWTQLHPQIISVPEMEAQIMSLKENFSRFFVKFRSLRMNYPTMFCLVVVTVLSVSASLGMLVPGMMLLYFTLMLICFWFSMSVIVPHSWLVGVARFRRALLRMGNDSTVSRGSYDSDLEEFIPEEGSLEAQAALHVPFMSLDPPDSGEMQNRDTRGSTRRRRRERTSSSEPPQPVTTGDTSYFTHGLPEDFPSYDNDSVDDLDQDIGLPEAMPSLTQDSIQYDPINVPTQSAEIRFVSSHFGSSEDEEEFTEGLSFRDQTGRENRHTVEPDLLTEDEGLNNFASSFLTDTFASSAANIFSIGGDLVSNVMRLASERDGIIAALQGNRINTEALISEDTTIPLTREEDLSSEIEDFEVISDDDLQ